MPQAWSPTDHSEFVTIVGDVATRIAGGGAFQLARSDEPQISGLLYAEVFIIAEGTNRSMVGLASSRSPSNDYAGTNTFGISYDSLGRVLMNALQVAGMPTFTTGDTIQIAANLDVKPAVARFRKKGAAWSSWLDISSLGTDIFVAVSLSSGASSSSARILNTAADMADFGMQPLNLIFAGDSQALGGAVMRPFAQRVVDIVSKRRKVGAWKKLGINGASGAYNWASSGYAYNLTQDITQRVVPALRPDMENWLVTYFASNGMVFPNHSAATEYTDTMAYVDAAIAACSPLIPATRMIMSCSSPRAHPNTPQSRIDAYNASLVGDNGARGYKVARVDLDPYIGAAAASPTALDTKWFGDGLVHWTDDGQQRFAEIAAALIQ